MVDKAKQGFGIMMADFDDVNNPEVQCRRAARPNTRTETCCCTLINHTQQSQAYAI
jgi:hypothetical protein